jgi:hypothetical protein
MLLPDSFHGAFSGQMFGIHFVIPFLCTMADNAGISRGRKPVGWIPS